MRRAGPPAVRPSSRQRRSQVLAGVRRGVDRPARLAALLEAPSIQKIFHHAMFDLRFLVTRWGFQPVSIKCTKIAAKLLYPGDSSRQSLRPLVNEWLGIGLDKTEQTSNWSARELSDAQIHYAVRDVLFLAPLASRLEDQLRLVGLHDLSAGCWAHVPTRVQLELRGLGDPFTY